MTHFLFQFVRAPWTSGRTHLDNGPAAAKANEDSLTNTANLLIAMTPCFFSLLVKLQEALLSPPSCPSTWAHFTKETEAPWWENFYSTLNFQQVDSPFNSYLSTYQLCIHVLWILSFLRTENWSRRFLDFCTSNILGRTIPCCGSLSCGL